MTEKNNGTGPKTEDSSSTFGDKAKDADALWASLAAKIPAPAIGTQAEESAGRSENTAERAAVSAPAAAPVADPQGKAVPAVAEAGPEASSLPDEGIAPVSDSPAKEAGERFDAAFEPGTPQPEEQAGTAKIDKKAKSPKPQAPSSGPFDGKALGPRMPSIAMMQDEDGNLVPTPPTVTSRIFSGLALLPILLPLILLIAQVAFTLDTRALWYSDEVRYADAYRNMGTTADWLVLQLNGAMYPDKPPMFFWMLHGLKESAALISPVLPFAVTENMIFFVGMAVSGIICLFAAHLLASMVGRVDRRTVLAADLILVGSFFFAGLLHYLRMDVLFTAFITFSHVFLYHALIRDKAPLLMVLAFLFAGSAVLVKGPLGFALPMLAGICFLLWQGRIVRVFRLDFILGLVMGLAVPGVWLALAWMNAGDPFLDNILSKQVLARALNTWHHAQSWYHYLITLPLIWLPWTLLLFFLPWGRFMGKGMREGVKASRTKSAAGIAYLWCAFLSGATLLSLVSIKIPIYCLPLFPPLAVLSARAILRMRPFAATCLQWSLAALLAVLSLVLLLLPMVPETMLPIPYIPAGTIILGGVCLVFACMLAFLVKPCRGEGMVLLVALFTTAFSYPVWAITAPSLDAFLSPKGQAEIIKSYKDAGYIVATYKVYPGTYTYYAGTVTDCESFEEALLVAEKNPKTVLALRASNWDKLEDKPAGFAEVDRRMIAERHYVVVARPPLGGAEKAASPSEPETGEPDEPVHSAPVAPAEGTVPDTMPGDVSRNEPDNPPRDTPGEAMPDDAAEPDASAAQNQPAPEQVTPESAPEAPAASPVQ